MPAPSLPGQPSGPSSTVASSSPSPPVSPRRVLLLGSPLLAAHAGLLWVGDLARHLEIALLLWAVAFAGLAWAIRGLGGEMGLASAPEPESEPKRKSRGVAKAGWALLGVALLLRLLLVPLQPTLSGDSDRYLWDGRVLAAGFNPYLLPPGSPELAPLRGVDGGAQPDAGAARDAGALWERLDHKQVPTVYPPLALGLFALAWAFPSPLLAWKLLLVVADLAACGWLLSLSRRGEGRGAALGVDLGAVAAYAWNPLVILEGAGMGHVDTLAVAAMIGVVLALRKARPGWAGVAAAAGILAKLGPLAALPAWTAWLRRERCQTHGRTHGRWRLALAFLGVAGGLAALGLAPMVLTTGGVPPGLVTYGVAWEFNGPVYEPLWRGLAALGADRWLAERVDWVKSFGDHHQFWNRFYPWLYPQFLAKLVLGLGMLTVVVRSWRASGGSLPAGDGLSTLNRRLFGGLLLCSATVYPWYLLWVLPWAALTRRWAWLVLSASILLAYVPQFGEIGLFPWIFLAIWGPPVLWSLATR